MKYFLLGAFSSAFFLYGVAMAYGATGTTKIAAIALALTGSGGTQSLALLGFALLASVFGFKVSAAPFHMWTPDVYQGAPTPVTAYMSAATKIAAFAALIRVLDVAFQALAWDWAPVVWGLAAVSIVLGSVLAIAQTNVKRMLAYSSIAHAGFILTGLGRGNGPDPLRDLLPGGLRGDDARGLRGRDARVRQGRGADRARDYAGLARPEPVDRAR